jgi:hypothetical protein
LRSPPEQLNTVREDLLDSTVWANLTRRYITAMDRMRGLSRVATAAGAGVLTGVSPGTAGFDFALNAPIEDFPARFFLANVDNPGFLVTRLIGSRE